MRSTIVGFILWIFLGAPFTVAAQQNVVFAVTKQDWAVISTATGKVSESNPFLTVVLDHYTMRVNKGYKWPVKVLRYKIGLAFRMPNGKWDIARWSEPVNQNFLLAAGQTKLIENYKAVIPIDGLSSLKDYWLVLAVETEINGTIGFNYAHSNKGMF